MAGYVGDGTNRWPAVHRSDAARLARLALESAPAGSVLHAVGDEGVPFREIAEAMGRHLAPDGVGRPGRRHEHFGPLGHFVGLDSPATAVVTRELLGWEPTGPTLLEDLGRTLLSRVTPDDRIEPPHRCRRRRWWTGPVSLIVDPARPCVRSRRRHRW